LTEYAAGPRSRSSHPLRHIRFAGLTPNVNPTGAPLADRMLALGSEPRRASRRTLGSMAR